MIDIDASFVESASPNSNTISNGRGLVAKGKFVGLFQSKDMSVIFGECQGSGRSNYTCSCDFVRPDSPVYRCSCPSRQFPCKHCIGLLFAFVDGLEFSVAEIPEDLAAKREKQQQRAEKKKAESTKPRKVNKAALAKKIKTQLDGLDLLEQLTHDLIRTGMGNTNAKTASQIEEQAKQLGNSFLPGAQSALHNYTRLFADESGRFKSAQPQIQEHIYSQGLDQLTRLNSLVKHGRKYLQKRLADPELQPETESPIATWLGHAWQLRELRDAGLIEKNVELIQLAFNSHDDVARREFVDTGIWMQLDSGAIRLTQNFRPYQAAKFIKSEDSFFRIAQISELCVYPGSMNPRIRWDEMESRPIERQDFQRVKEHAHCDFSSLIKTIRGHLKSPLAEKQPVVAINYRQIGQVDQSTFVVEDRNEERLVFTETGIPEEPESCHLMQLLPNEMLSNQTMIARFHQDLDARSLRVKPLSIVTDSQIYRLTL